MPTSFLQIIDFGMRALLFTKFGDILSLENVNDGVILYPKGIALREMAEKRGKVKLELVNLWRTKTAPDWKRQRTPAARRGMTLGYTDEGQTVVSEAKAVPVDLGYDIWFWTHDKEKLNLVSERYLFWQQDNPNLNLLVDEAYPVELDLHFGELLDESVVEEKYERGQILILKVPITVDGWVFTTFTVKSIAKIILTFYDADEVESYSEIIVEDSNQDVEKETVLKLFEKEIVFSV